MDPAQTNGHGPPLPRRGSGPPPPVEGGETTLRDLVTAARRRIWLFAILLVVIPLATLVVTLGQKKVYEASADVLINQDSVANQLAGDTSANTSSQDADRLIATQAALAHTPGVARRALAAVPGTGYDVPGFLKHSSVDPKPGTNVLTLRAQGSSQIQSIALTRAFARSFVDYGRATSAAQIGAARAKIRQRLAQIRKTGRAPGGSRGSVDQLYAQLVSRDLELQALQSAPASSRSVIRDPDKASRVQPRPLRNLLLAIALALVLGIGITLVRSSLDTRVASTDEVEKLLGAPLLARLPKPPSRQRGGLASPTLLEAHGSFAEAFALLRSSLPLADGGPGPILMVTSATEQEGKSSTVAGLAVSLARAGRRVTVIDADLRRPTLGRMFGVEASPGLVDVLVGGVPVADVEVELPADAWSARTTAGAGPGWSPREEVDSGRIAVIPAGRAGDLAAQDLLGLPRMQEVVRGAAEGSDIVLVDSPPVLAVADPVMLAPLVDGLLVIAAVNKLRRPGAREMARILAGTGARVTGFVTTGVAESELGAYPYQHGYRYRYANSA